MNDQKLCRGVELEGEHVRRGCEAERSHALRLRERQRFFEEAFQQDVEHYLSTGVLQLHSAGGARQPLGSVSSMEVNVDLLEQVELLDVSDQEALDVFLNSPSSPSGASSGASSSASATSSVSSMGPSCQTSPRHVWRASSTSSSSEASGPDSTPLFSPLPATPLPPATPTIAAAGNLTAETGAGVGAVNRGDEEDNEEEEEEGSGAAVPCVQADEEEVFVDTALTATTEDDSSPRPCDSDTD